MASALVWQTEGVTKSLAAREDFVMFLFTLMSNKKVFLQTATLIEDILSVRKVKANAHTLYFKSLVLLFFILIFLLKSQHEMKAMIIFS